MSPATIPFPKRPARGRRKGFDPSNPPVLLSVETPAPTEGITCSGLIQGNLLRMLYFPPGTPQPWRANDNQTMITSPDGAVFLFENHESDPAVERYVERALARIKAEAAAERLSLYED